MLFNYYQLTLITCLGNALLVGTLAVAAAFYLVLAGDRKAALALIGVFIVAAGAIGVAKLLCLDCHINPFGELLHSPSGHVGLATAVYCAIMATVSAGMKGWQRLLLWGCVACLIYIIAYSRVYLGFHTPDEVVAGFVVGGVVYGVARAFVIRPKPVAINGRALAATAVVIVFLLHGVTVTFEPAIEWIAEHFGTHISVC